MAVKVIDDWKKAWKFASVQISAVGFILMSVIEMANSALISLPPHLQQQIPHASTVGLVLFGLGLVGRLFKLKEKIQDGDQQP